MSLYGGIKFGSTGDEAAAAGGSSTQDKGSNGKDAASTSSTSVSGGSTAKPIPKATGEWSASLKFAPRVNKPKPPPSSSRAAASGGFGASAHSGMSTPTSAISQPASPGPGGPGGGAFAATGAGTGAGAVIERSADIVRSAEPKLVRTDEVMLGPDGKPLARAPAMTLAQDKAMRGGGAGAISGSGPMKRDRDGRSENKRKKKKKKKQHVVPLFDPEEQYDPNKPNDLGEYQAYRKRLREERRARLLEEKRRRAAGEDSEGSSYYTDSEEDAPRRDAPRMFAPPKMYSPPAASAALPPPRSAHAPSTAAGLASASTGDDAYARRQAMTQPSSGDDAYARRAAMAQPASGDDAYAARAAMSQIDPGEDAYARRVAMSQYQPPPFQPPPPPPPPSVPAPPPSFTPARPPPSTSFAPPPTLTPTLPHFIPTPPQAMTGAPSPPSAVSAPPPPLSSAPPPPSGIPGFGTFTPPAPPAPAPPAAGAAPPPSPADFQKLLQEKMQAASAIAAKYAHLSPVAPPGPSTQSSVAPVPPPAQSSPLTEDESGTFAEKMMRRWGHKEGSGLGASGSGIVHALTTEHVESAPKPVDPNQPLSKRQIAKQKAAAANVKNRKWVQHAHARGRIVNANEDEQAAEDKARLGEASRVICLRGLVGSVDDVDEDLADEIGEECSNYGIVERVVLHMVEPPPPEPSECLRIFVVFSGMAGAWRATKELDGRFFGGRKIRATYFDEATFDAGARDGEI